MKKRTKIILAITAVLLAFLGYFGYGIYEHVLGSEKLEGVEAIPEAKEKLSEVTFGTDDWPNWRGENLDGKSQTVGIRTDWNNDLKKLWQVDFLCQDNSTGSWSSVAVQGDRLLVPGRDKDNDLLFCLNANTGELIWKGSYPTEASSPHGKGPRGTPAIDNNRVYSFGRSGDLYCWSLNNGDVLWNHKLTDLGGEVPMWGYSISPFIYEDKVIIQGGGEAQMLAFDKMSGKMLWKSGVGHAGFSTATTVTLEDETFLLIYHGLGLSLVNPDNGNVLWTMPWETSYGVNSTTPIVSGDIVYHTSGYDMGSQALKISKEGYKVLWYGEEFYAHHSDPILIDGYLYGYSGENQRNKGEFMCVELESGKIMWRTNLIGQGTTVFVDDHLLCLDYKTNVFLVKPNTEKFELVATHKSAVDKVRYVAWTSPVVANGKLYVRYLQNLSCFDLMK